MKEKFKRIVKFVLFFIYSNVIYGLIVYFVFTWLAGYSLLVGYFGNLALIIIGLVLDANIHKTLQSKKLEQQLMSEKNPEQSYRHLQFTVDNYVSFKTTLYLFYVIILIFAQIIVFYPTLLNENVSHFITANNYSILLLIAFDMLAGQFSKDKERKKAMSENLNSSMAGLNRGNINKEK